MFWVDSTRAARISAVMVSVVLGLAITVGFHRYFSHRSFKTSRWFQFGLGFVGCAALQNGPLWWAANHREHHTHADRAADPHSPVVRGFWHGHVGWMMTRDNRSDYGRAKDLTIYPELRWLDRFWVWPAILTAAVFYAFMGWTGVIWAYCLGVVQVYQITCAVNSIGHLFGPRRFNTGDGSRNNFVLGYLAMGDGWHNNHHRAPSSARHGFAWYEWDLAYGFILLLSGLGLVWDVKRPPKSVMAGLASPPNPTDQCDPVSAEAAERGHLHEPAVRPLSAVS
jgi:stearoyl-CoA desaturase (delta-9 desaturase)